MIFALFVLVFLQKLKKLVNHQNDNDIIHLIERIQCKTDRNPCDYGHFYRNMIFLILEK